MSTSSIQLVRREGGGVWVRPDPARLGYTWTDLVTADGHTLRANLGLAIRVINRPVELRYLGEAIGTEPVCASHVQRHFEPALHAAAVAAVETLAAEAVLAETGREALAQAVLAAARKAAFACGVEVLPPCQVELESPSLARQRLEAMQRQATEQRQAARLKQLEQTAALLQRFGELRQSTPELSASALLGRLEAGDGAAMLQSLLAISAQQQEQTRWLFVAAGPGLWRIDLQANPPSASAVPLPADLGPLRSVQREPGGALLVGARGGIHLIHPDDPAAGRAFADAQIVSQMGFNRCAIWAGEIWGSHSEAGLVGWRPDAPDLPLAALRPVQIKGAAPRNLLPLDDDRLVFSSGPRLLTLRRDGELDFTAGLVPPEAPADILAILRVGQQLLTILQNGTAQWRDADTLEVTAQRQLGGPLLAAAALPWLDGARLLVAPESGPLLALGLEDSLVTQFTAPTGGYRAVTATADSIAAISPDRQRLLVWRTAEPGRPAADLHVPSLARHRAADVAL